MTLTLARQKVQQTSYYNEDENWGDLDRVHPVLIDRAIHFRKIIDCPVYLSPVEGAVFAESGHSSKSWHKPLKNRNDLGMAMDVFPKCDLHTAWLVALQSGFTGVGVYPYWTWADKQLWGGLHLDIRPQYYITGWWKDDMGNYNFLSDVKNYEALIQELT